MLTALAMTALAGPPTVNVMDDHAIVGTLVVAVPAAQVKAKLADPIWVSKVDGGGTIVTKTGERDGCGLYDNVSPSAIKTVRYSTRYCATKTGFRTHLEASESFEAYRAEWTVTEGESGTVLRYDLKIDTNLMVPQWILDRTTKKAVGNLLAKLQTAL